MSLPNPAKYSNYCRSISILIGCLIFTQQLAAQASVITGFSPSSGKPRDTIIITGQYFRDVLAVKFGGVHAASFQFINSTTIKAVVGAGATGAVAIESLNGTPSLAGFTFTGPPPPSISSFAPAMGEAGTEVIIKGTNFSPELSRNIVLFGVEKATVTKAAQNELTVLAPAGATAAPISVTVNDFTASSNYPFILTFAGGGFILPSSFGANIYVGTGQLSKNICFSDLDGDGKPDLVILNSTQNTVSLFKNLSTPESPAFATGVVYPTALSPRSVTAGDLNGDGKPDLVITNDAGGSSSISTYINTSTGGVITLGIRQGYWTGLTDYSYPQQACIADLDLDGRPDVAVANSDNTVTVFKNTSDYQTIWLKAGVNFHAGTALKTIAASDLDGDLKPDLAVTGIYSTNIIILKNNCTPTQIAFAVAASLPCGQEPFHLAIGDIDNDQKMEIAVANSGGSLSIFKNNSGPGIISFAPRNDLVTGGYLTWVALGDLDGDGKQDLAAASSGSSAGGPEGVVFLLKNLSDQNKIAFAAPLPLKTGAGYALSVAIADVDGDGIPDLAANTQSGTIAVTRNRVKAAHITSFFPVYGGTGSVIAIKGQNLKNTQTVSFGDKVASSFSILSDTLVQAVVGAGSSGSVVVTAPPGNGTGTGFTYATVPLIHHFAPLTGTAGTIITITGANFNTVPENNIVYMGAVKAQVSSATANQLQVIAPYGADHKPITVTTGGLTAHANRPFYLTYPGAAPNFHAGTFAAKQDISIPAPSNLYATDLNQDGKPDLIATDWYGDKIIVFPNNSQPGKIAVGNKIELPVQKYPGAVKTCDLDGDGKPDLIAIASRVSIYRNTSTGTNISFSTLPATELLHAVRTYAIGDLDNDGRPDIAALTEGGLFIFKNTSSAGSISFEPKEYDGIDNTPRGITICDFNKDGKTDLAVSKSSQGVIAIFANTSTVGNISFGNELLFVAGNGPIEGITTADADNDSYPDIVVNTYNSNTISVLRNVSRTSIAFESNVDLGTGVRPYSFQVGDLDGDGKPDLAALNGNINVPSTLSLLKNTSTQSMSFQPKFDYPGIEKINEACITDLDLDGKPDLVASFLNDNIISIFRNRSNEARIIGSGANPVAGNVVSTVTIDASVQLYNGQPYLQRHYEITPENAATATGTVTLFFTQQEFNNFNAHPAHGADLPKNDADNAGIANLRIYKYHGFSATGAPGTYDGGGIEIDPDDTKVVWNVNAQWWEVTFQVTGFSHFFVSSAGFTYQQAPAPLVAPDGNTTFCGGGQVMLRVNAGSGFQWYRNGIAINGANANTFVATVEGEYTATITVNGIRSLPSNRVAVQVRSVPAKPVITNNGPELRSSSVSGNQWFYEGTIIGGATQQDLRPQQTGNYTVIVSANDCKSAASEKFYYTFTGVINIDNVQYVKLSPNPVEDFLSLHFNISGVSRVSIQLIDARGKICGVFSNLSNGSNLYLANYAKGVYFAKIVTAHKKTYSMKLVKL